MKNKLHSGLPAYLLGKAALWRANEKNSRFFENNPSEVFNSKNGKLSKNQRVNTHL